MNVTTTTEDSVTTKEQTPSSTTTTTTTTTTKPEESMLPDLIDLVSKESEFVTNFTDSAERNIRTINYGNHKFSSPIIVGEEKLFIPNDEFTKKQINVQIIEPEPHNNGQFLKETLYQTQQNNSVITTITSTTTEAPRLPRIRTSTQKTISSKFSAPLHGGLRLVNDLRKSGEDCDDENDKKLNIQATTATIGAGRKEEIEIHRNTKISKVVIESPQRNPYQGRFTTRRPPCEQPCSTPRPVIGVTSNVRPASIALTSARPLPLVTTPIPQVVHQPVTQVVHQPVAHVVHQPVAHVVHQPVVVHSQTPVPVEKIVNRPVPYPVEKIVKQLVKIPVPVEVEKLVVKEVKVPVDRVIEKHVNHAIPVDRPYPVEKVVEKFVQVPYEVQKFIDRPVEIQKLVTQQVHVPVDRVVEKFIDRPYPVEKIVQQPVAVPVDRIIEKIVDRPVEVERVVEKQVPVVVEKFVDRPIPVHVPYYVHVQVPVHSPVPYAIHVPVPVLLKPPPPPKTHFIIKTTKYTKHSGLVDLKNKLNNNLKSIFYKKPNIIHMDTIGLRPPPR